VLGSALQQALDQIDFERLGVERVAPGLEHSGPLFISQTRQGNDYGVLATGGSPKAGRYLAAIQIRQPDVQENELRLQLARHFQSCGAVRRISGIVPHVEQQQEKALRRIDVVIDHKDAVSAAWRALEIRLHDQIVLQPPCAA